MKGRKLTITSCLFVLAILMIVYGLGFNTTTVAIPATAQPAAPGQSIIQLSESEVIFDTTVGGLRRVDSGSLIRTYSGKPPSACPT
ncbi:MAG: hypothetical protein ACYTE8_09705 [Planctomycetota bacterium]|jgi:hypothetical protein